MNKTYAQHIEHLLTYGQRCTICGRGKMREFGYYKGSKYATMTLKCEKCGGMRDEVYPIKVFNEAVKNAPSR